MRSMSNPMTCFRIPPELRAQLAEICAAQSISMSEWMRALVASALGSGAYGMPEGYTAGRQMANHLLHEALRQALDSMPPTIDEAVARFGMPRAIETAGGE